MRCCEHSYIGQDRSNEYRLRAIFAIIWFELEPEGTVGAVTLSPRRFVSLSHATSPSSCMDHSFLRIWSSAKYPQTIIIFIVLIVGPYRSLTHTRAHTRTHTHTRHGSTTMVDIEHSCVSHARMHICCMSCRAAYNYIHITISAAKILFRWQSSLMGWKWAHSDIILV